MMGYFFSFLWIFEILDVLNYIVEFFGVVDFMVHVLFGLGERGVI